MTTILAYIKILRPLNLTFCAITVIISAFLCNNLGNYLTIIQAIIVVISFAGASNVLNDILDIKIDCKNQPQRPLPSQAITIKSSYFYMIILYLVGIFTTFYLNKLAATMALIVVLPILIFYTSYLKKIAILGNISIASMLGMVFLFSESALLGKVEKLWTPALLAFGINLIRELIKDIADIEGDKIGGAKTFPVLYGVNKSLLLVYILIIIFCVLSLIPFIMGEYGYLYLLALFFLVVIPLILVILFLLKNSTSLGCSIVSKATKYIILGGMLTIFLTEF